MSLRRRLLSISYKTFQRFGNQPCLRSLWDGAWDPSNMHLRCIRVCWGIPLLSTTSSSINNKHFFRRITVSRVFFHWKIGWVILNKKYIWVAAQKLIFTSEYGEVRQLKFSLLFEILALFVLLWAIRQASFFLYHDNIIVHPRYYDISKIGKICWSLYLFFKGFFSQFLWRMNHQW